MPRGTRKINMHTLANSEEKTSKGRKWDLLFNSHQSSKGISRMQRRFILSRNYAKQERRLSIKCALVQMAKLISTYKLVLMWKLDSGEKTLAVLKSLDSIFGVNFIVYTVSKPL